MVKVLENQIVDLDVLPGTKEEQLRAQADKLSFVLPLPNLPSIRLVTIADFRCDNYRQQGLENLPPEARKVVETAQQQAPSGTNLPEQDAAKPSQGPSGVAQDTLNTVGGGVKGVVDTLGNTVGTLGGGLSDTVGGVAGGVGNVVTGAGNTVRAGLGGGDKDTKEEENKQ